MIIETNLAETLDLINEALFYNYPMSKTQMIEAVTWICQQQNKSGKSAGMFIVTAADYRSETRLFTGEKLKTKLARRNILTQEAARVLALSNISSDEVKATLVYANRWMLQSCYAAEYCAMGECRHSAIGFMRYLTVSKLEDSEQRLENHIQVLKKRRDGKGRWNGFPFYYTLLALSEINLPSAIRELQYSIPACKRSLKRTTGTDKFSRRRQAIIQKVLTKNQYQKPLHSHLDLDLNTLAHK